MRALIPIKNVVLRSLTTNEIEYHRKIIQAQISDSNIGIDLLEMMDLLSATEKAIVWRISGPANKGHLVLKKYIDPAAYIREKDAYVLFRGGPIAAVIGEIEEYRILILEFFSCESSICGSLSLADGVRAIAYLHNAADSNVSKFKKNGFGEFHRRSKCRFGASIWVSLRACRNINRNYLIGRKRPTKLFNVAVGDIKREHLIPSRGCLKIVDLETFSLTAPVWQDIFGLFKIFSIRSNITRYRALLFYCRLRGIKSKVRSLKRICVHLRVNTCS